MENDYTSRFIHLQCSSCGKVYDPRPMNHCMCGKPLLARYEFRDLRQADLLERRDVWRYAPMLPVRSKDNIVTLGEGATPLIRADKIAAKLGIKKLYVKDEGANPTGTFKARGMTVAVSKAKELGITKLAVATTGSAGSSLAAYAQRAGIQAYVAFARGANQSHTKAAELFGANIDLNRGHMNDAILAVRKVCEEQGYFNIATMHEPYRTEGKKTIALEVAEQLGDLPDVMLFPVGGGTGIVAAWKAWLELKELGWCKTDVRLFFVQAAGCAPVYEAWRNGMKTCEPCLKVSTKATGLAIPKPFGDELILRSVRETNGGGVVVSDDEMAAGSRDYAKYEKISSCLEGAATLPALKRLLEQGLIDKDESVVLINTGKGPARRV